MRPKFLLGFAVTTVSIIALSIWSIRRRRKKWNEVISLVLQVHSGKAIPDGRLREVFIPIFRQRRSLNAKQIASRVKGSHGFVPAIATIRVCRQWNSIAPPERTIHIEPLIGPLRMRYKKHLSDMKGLVSQSLRLKQVFSDRWFSDAEEVIDRWDGSGSLQMRTHTAFIGYFHDATDDPSRDNVLEEIDEAFDIVGRVTGRALKAKLRQVTGSHDAYVSTAFEMLVLGKFAERNLIEDYEPDIGSGRPEARVDLSGQKVLIEARATLDWTRADGSFDPEDYGGTLSDKGAEKYRWQLHAASEPVVMFLGMNISALGIEEEVMLRNFSEDPDARILSAVMLADDYKARRFKIWVHPSPRYPLTSAAIGKLKEIFQANDFQPSGLVRPTNRSLNI